MFRSISPIGVVLFFASAVSASTIDDEISASFIPDQQLLQAESAVERQFKRSQFTPPSRHIHLDLIPTQSPAVQAVRNSKEVPRQLRVGRGYELARVPDYQFGNLNWIPDGEQFRAIMELSIPEEAAAVRLGIDPASIPEGVSLYFYSPRFTEFRYGPYSTDTITDKDIFWTPVIEGDRVRVELYADVPASVAYADLGVRQVSVLSDSVMHQYWRRQSEVGSSGQCNINVACDSTALDVGATTAKYLVSDLFGNTFLCSGVLVNDTFNSGTPWFISADHCLGEYGVPGSMQFYWNFRSGSCNANSALPIMTTTGGATELYASLVTDVVFFRLNEDPPTTARAGWTAAREMTSNEVFGIHHPGGDLQKVSVGSVLGLANWNILTLNQSHYRVRWSQGVTESGSSGSGLFNSHRQLIGILSGGSSSCNSRIFPDYYGRFDMALPHLRQWLADNPPPGTRVSVRGKVAIAGTPVCGLVLINGQHAFTCDGTGRYDLNVPVDSDGRVAIQFFADGFTPYNQITAPGGAVITRDLAITRASGGTGAPIVTLEQIAPLENNRVRLVGKVASSQGLPLCSMVLANGVHAFTCQGDGRFDLDVPRDSGGQVTLFGFSHGMSPFRQVISQF